MTEQRLKEVFGAYGTIKWCRVDRGKGAKAGQVSAIVELDTVDEANYFVTALDENIPEGLTTPIRVKYKPDAKPKTKGAGKGSPLAQERSSPYPVLAGGKGKGLGGGIEDVIKGLTRAGALPGGKWANDENTVFVSGLPQDTTNNDLLRLFSPFGAIAAGGAYCVLNKENGTAKGTGIINFLDATGAQSAVAGLNGVMMPNGMSLRLRLFTPRDKPGAGK